MYPVNSHDTGHIGIQGGVDGRTDGLRRVRSFAISMFTDNLSESELSYEALIEQNIFRCKPEPSVF